MALLALQACGIGGLDDVLPRPARPDVIPWVATPAGPVPTPTPAAPPTPLRLRSCQASDLGARLDPGGAAAGTSYTVIVFTNRSGSACALQGQPALRLFDETGGLARQPAVSYAGTDWTPAALPAGVPEGEPGSPPSPGQAVMRLRKAGVTCVPFSIVRLVITLPDGGGELELPWRFGADLGADCIQAPVGVDSFGPASPPAPAPPPAPQLVATYVGPASVEAGQTLKYRIQLRNVSGHTIRLQPCPGYTEGLKGVESRRYLLNCEPVGAIKPGDTVTFAMEVAIPARVSAGAVGPPGLLAFSWTLDQPWPAAVSAQLTVTKTAGVVSSQLP